MNTDCPFEPNVIDAVTNDAMTGSLRAHIASCESCAAAAEVTPWMNSFAGINEREHILLGRARGRVSGCHLPRSFQQPRREGRRRDLPAGGSFFQTPAGISPDS